jgi:hypothetical protein
MKPLECSNKCKYYLIDKKPTDIRCSKCYRYYISGGGDGDYFEAKDKETHTDNRDISNHTKYHNKMTLNTKDHIRFILHPRRHLPLGGG